MYKNAVLETLMLGKIEGKEEKRVTEDEMLGWLKLNGYEWGTGKTGVLQTMGLQRVGHDWATEQQPKVQNYWSLH